MSILERRKAKASSMVLAAPIAALAITGMGGASAQGSPIGASDVLVYSSGTAATPDSLAGSIVNIIDFNTTSNTVTQQFNITNLTGDNTAATSTTLFANNNGSNGQLALSDGGTLVTFGGYQGNSSNELVQNVHQAGALDATGTFTLGAQYNESSSGTGNGQIRSAYTPDGSAYVFADKDGVYTGGAGPAPTTNVRYLAGFAGTDFALAQASSATLPSTTAFFTYSAGTLTPVSVPNSNFSAGTDFDFVQSGAVGEGNAYDTLYVANGANILKYDYVGGVLTTEGTDVVTGLGGKKIVDLTAEEDGLGDVDIYFTAGGNTTLDETIDTTGWDNPIGNTAGTLLYTAPTGQDLFGVSVAPVAVPEPASLGLLGLTGLGLLSRRRKSVAK